MGSIMIIHQGALGDFILALPVLETIRRACLKEKIYIMGYPRILELVEKRFYADEILSIDQKGIATFFVKNGSLDFKLSQFFKEVGLIVIFGKDSESALMKNIKKISRGKIININSFPPWDEKIHLIDHLLRELSKYGFNPYTLFPKIYLNQRDREWAKDFWKSKGVDIKEREKIILIHPGSGSKKKVWPVENFLKLSNYLQNHIDRKIAIIIGPAEGDEIQNEIMKDGLNNKIVIRGLSLIQLASVIEGCNLFIGNDSGVSHLASALGIRTVTLFGPTNHIVWAPRGERNVIIRKEIPCSPCTEERFFQCRDPECLKMIRVEEVLEKIINE